jgi:hypothetical protein
LTPRGWEPGAWYIAGAGAFQVPIPVDRVASYEFSRHKGTGDAALTPLFLSEDSAGIVDLLVKFGPPPRVLHTQFEQGRDAMQHTRSPFERPNRG